MRIHLIDPRLIFKLIVTIMIDFYADYVFFLSNIKKISVFIFFVASH